MAAAVFMAALLSSFHSSNARCAALCRFLGQAVFQPFAVQIRGLLVDFAARAGGQVLVSWHVSETGHLRRSAGAQAYRGRGL